MNPKFFPYISSMTIRDCFVIHNLDITVFNGNEFKHLIFTGKNGSGKSTILNTVNFIFDKYIRGEKLEGPVRELKQIIDRGDNSEKWRLNAKEEIRKRTGVELHLLGKNPNELFPYADPYQYFPNSSGFIYSHFRAHRKVELQEVETVTKEENILNEIRKNSSHESYLQKFKQYLVNKKVYQAFAVIDDDSKMRTEADSFFNKFQDILRSIFNDNKLKLEFEKKEFDFFLKMSDGRTVNFSQLSDGYSAIISMLMDLLMRRDIIQKEVSDFSYEPPGIVLIDEPECHLHIETQYNILPLIASLFPNLQLIVATHSPAVLSSIKNATIFDVSSKKYLEGKYLSTSFSELMVTHFGLDNEFSNIADALLIEIKNMMADNNDYDTLKTRVSDFVNKHSDEMSPSLLFELDTLLALRRASLEK